MNSIYYRSLDNSDLPELVKLIQTELIPMSYTVSPDDASVIAGLPDRLRSGETIVAALSKRGKTLGFVHFSLMQGILHIDMLVIHPQSRKHGIGKELMRLAEQRGRIAGSVMSVLYVDDVNEKARRFYIREGYESVRHFPELKVTMWTKPL